MIISPLAFIFAVGTVSCTVPASTTVILPTAIPDESKPNFDPFSPDGRFTGIDGPNVQPINETVFDWWYFDVVALPDSEDSSNQNTPAEARSDGPLASMVITLFASTNKAFPFLPPTSDEENVLTAYIWLTFPNGTWASKYIHADQATIVTSGAGGSSGKFDSTGFSWSSAEDMSKYTIKVDAEDTLGMKGVIEMETITPPRIPCAVLDRPQKEAPNKLRPMEVAPELGWSNPIPDAIGTVDFTIDGSRLKFQGTAYHDKNWSPRPFDPALKSWYWGHARLGPYSVVWFDLTTGGERYVSAYLSCPDTEVEEGKPHVLVSSCESHSVVVTPREGMEAGNFRVRFEIGGGKGSLEVDVRPEQFIAGGVVDGVRYARWAGRVSGRVVGGGEGACCGEDGERKGRGYEGTSVYEEFVKLPDGEF